jgi:uncharacterized protein (DUF488 family)
MASLATIGYQTATVDSFRRALKSAGIELLVDIRAVASSRRPGFSKTKLAANVAELGIDYLHMRALGTPADGRAAAKAKHHEEMRRIYVAHLATPDAQAALEDLAEIVRAGRRLCLLCFETEPEHCHRSIVAASLASMMPLRVTHLIPDVDPLY